MICFRKLTPARVGCQAFGITSRDNSSLILCLKEKGRSVMFRSNGQKQGSVMSHGHMENSCCHMQGLESHMGDKRMHDGCVFDGNPNHSKDVQQPATASQHCSSDSPSEPPGGEPHACTSSAHVQSLDQAHVDRPRSRSTARLCRRSGPWPR